MANRTQISPIAKPTIWLVGDEVTSTSIFPFSARVDHAKHIGAVKTMTIGGVTDLKQEKILTFDRQVRVIITASVVPKVSYVREGGALAALEFEGSKRNNKSLINLEAETYYTLNGKDPVRTKAHLYNYRDLNDTTGVGYENPSLRPSLPDVDRANLSSLGFILSASVTGGDLITLKARTYQLGDKSRVAVAIFKIAHTQGSTTFENIDTGV